MTIERFMRLVQLASNSLLVRHYLATYPGQMVLEIADFGNESLDQFRSELTEEGFHELPSVLMAGGKLLRFAVTRTDSSHSTSEAVVIEEMDPYVDGVVPVPMSQGEKDFLDRATHMLSNLRRIHAAYDADGQDLSAWPAKAASEIERLQELNRLSEDAFEQGKASEKASWLHECAMEDDVDTVVQRMGYAAQADWGSKEW